jgi:hypothetical protein
MTSENPKRRSMMIEIMPESHDNILGARATGKLTDDDYKNVLIPRMEELAEEHGNARFLFFLDSGFEGLSLIHI